MSVVPVNKTVLAPVVMTVVPVVMTVVPVVMTVVPVVKTVVLAAMMQMVMVVVAR